MKIGSVVTTLATKTKCLILKILRKNRSKQTAD